MADIKDVMKDLSKRYERQGVEDKFIPSGSVIFDAVLSNGKGIPLRKFIQISSDSGIGKSTAVLHFSKVACAKGYDVVYMDVEKGVNEGQLRGIGLDKFLNDKFFLYPISTFEDAEEVVDKILENKNLAYVVIDSITALVPQRSLEKSIAEVEPGLNARYSSAFLAKYKALLERSGCPASFIFINQMRNKLNFRGMTTFEAAGGNAQKFYMDIRLMMNRKDKLEKTTETMEGKKTIPYGANVTVWADKNRHNRPYIEGVLTILFGRGISNIAAYQRALLSKGALVQGGGGYYTLTLPGSEAQKARGADGVMKLIKENMAQVKQYIEETGGFVLIEEDPESFV